MLRLESCCFLLQTLTYSKFVCIFTAIECLKTLVLCEYTNPLLYMIGVDFSETFDTCLTLNSAHVMMHQYIYCLEHRYDWLCLYFTRCDCGSQFISLNTGALGAVNQSMSQFLRHVFAVLWCMLRHGNGMQLFIWENSGRCKASGNPVVCLEYTWTFHMRILHCPFEAIVVFNFRTLEVVSLGDYLDISFIKMSQFSGVVFS